MLKEIELRERQISCSFCAVWPPYTRGMLDMFGVIDDNKAGTTVSSFLRGVKSIIKKEIGLNGGREIKKDEGGSRVMV